MVMLKKLIRKRRFRICLIIVLIWCTMFTTDYVRASNNQRPIFAVPIFAVCGAVRHFGIGYQVIVDRSFSHMIVEIGPWFMPVRRPDPFPYFPWLPIEDVPIYPNDNYYNEQLYSQDFDDIVDMSTIPRAPDWSKNTESYIKVTFKPGYNEYNLAFDMSVVELYANPKVHYCAGRVAIKRGPIVYCAESIDNGENLKSVKISTDPNYKCEPSKIHDNDIIKITCDCEVVKEVSDVLYSDTLFKSEKSTLTLIPYAAWANRGRCEMIVWLGKM